MTGRGGIAGLSLLCVLALCAFAAPNAMALKGTTAYTCQPVKAGATFSDEHCTKGVGGGEGWIHAEIANGVETPLTVTNNETAAKTVPAKLKAEVDKEAFEAEASAFTDCGEKAARVKNSVAGKNMKVSGLFCGEFTGVVVKKPAECDVAKKAIKLEGGIWFGQVLVNPFGKEAMWLEFVPEAGLPLATFEITGAKCPLNGKKVEVTGAAPTDELFAGSPLVGATVKFTTKRTGLVLEANGAPAEFEGTFTPRMLLEGGKATNPITVTTTEE
jgi:hypothetical protein